MVSLCNLSFVCCRTRGARAKGTRHPEVITRPGCYLPVIPHAEDPQPPTTANRTSAMHHPRQPSFCAPSLATNPTTSDTYDKHCGSQHPAREPVSPLCAKPCPLVLNPPIRSNTFNRRPRLAAPPPSPARYGPHPPSRNRAPPTAAHHQTLPWCAAGMAQPTQCGWAAYTWQSAAGEADGAEGV